MDLSISLDRRGQVMEPDFLASLLVFSIIIGSFIVTWNTVTSSSTMLDEEAEMEQNAKRAVSFLISTPGYPNDWEEEGEVQIMGLAKEQNVIDREKLDAFDELSYENQSRALKVRNFYMEFREKDSDNVIEHEGELLVYGEMYDEDVSSIVPVKRSVMIDLPDGLKPAEMRFLVYRR